MKTPIKIIASGLLISSALFTACKKEDLNQNAGPATTVAAQYRLPLENVPLVQFTSGRIIANYVGLTTDNKVFLESRETQPIDLFMPVSEIGGFESLTHGTFNYMAAIVKLAANTGRASMTLNGNLVNAEGRGTPVVFMVDGPLTMTTSPRFENITPNTTLLNLMGITPEKLSSSMNMDMWNKAVMTNGQIEVSANSNQDIYKIMLNNMANMVRIEYSMTPDGSVTQSISTPQ